MKHHFLVEVGKLYTFSLSPGYKNMFTPYNNQFVIGTSIGKFLKWLKNSDINPHIKYNII